MTTFEPSEYARIRARQNAASVKKTKLRNPYGAGYIRDTIMQCPKHHVDYVLRLSNREAPALLMYDCPEEGCFNTLQVPTKR
jgi:hypothetical protein